MATHWLPAGGEVAVTTKDTQQVIVRMPADLHAALKERAAADERSMSQAIRHAIRRYLESEQS